MATQHISVLKTALTGGTSRRQVAVHHQECYLQTEKELQSGGEVKELAEVADKLSKRLVKDTTAWTNKRESLGADQAACQQVC